LEESSAKEIAGGLRNNVSLKTLIMSHNGLEDEGCVFFGEMLRDNVGMEDLDLSATRMGRGQ